MDLRLRHGSCPGGTGCHATGRERLSPQHPARTHKHHHQRVRARLKKRRERDSIVARSENSVVTQSDRRFTRGGRGSAAGQWLSQYVRVCVGGRIVVAQRDKNGSESVVKTPRFTPTTKTPLGDLQDLGTLTALHAELCSLLEQKVRTLVLHASPLSTVRVGYAPPLRVSSVPEIRRGVSPRAFPPSGLYRKGGEPSLRRPPKQNTQ